MTEVTQGEVRAWARAQGMAVNDRGSLPATVRSAYAAAHHTPSGAVQAKASPATAGLSDLAGGLRGLLDAIDTEVRAVSRLSQRIDALVGDLNAVRDEQATRLLVLDELQAAATEPSLGTFLSNAIRPQTPQVPEVVPKRLR